MVGEYSYAHVNAHGRITYNGPPEADIASWPALSSALHRTQDTSYQRSRTQRSVVARVINATDGETVQSVAREALSTKVDLLATDEYRGYWTLKKDYPHKFVRHGADEYVMGAVHTHACTIDGF